MDMRIINGTARVAVVASILAAALMVAGCDDPNYVAPPRYTYDVYFLGFKDFTTDTGSANLRVPIPSYGEKALLPFNGTLDRDIPESIFWKNSYVNLNSYGLHSVSSLAVNLTPYGTMLNINVNQTGYYEAYPASTPSPCPDVTSLPYGAYRFNKTTPAFDELRTHIQDMLGPIGSAKTNDTISALCQKPLYPDAGIVDTPYTMWIEGANSSNLSYTSYIYIDPSLRAKASDSTIELYAVFDVIVGFHPYGSPGDHHVYVIKESIPPGVTGYIPVKVQYAGVFQEFGISDKWAPKRPLITY